MYPMKHGSPRYIVCINVLTSLCIWLYSYSNLNSIPGAHLTINRLWLAWWLGTEQASSHYQHHWRHIFLMHTCVIRPQRIRLWYCTWCTLWNMVPLCILMYKYIECFDIYMAPNIAVRLNWCNFPRPHVACLMCQHIGFVTVLPER